MQAQHAVSVCSSTYITYKNKHKRNRCAGLSVTNRRFSFFDLCQLSVVLMPSVSNRFPHLSIDFLQRSRILPPTVRFFMATISNASSKDQQSFRHLSVVLCQLSSIFPPSINNRDYTCGSISRRLIRSDKPEPHVQYFVTCPTRPHNTVWSTPFWAADMPTRSLHVP